MQCFLLCGRCIEVHVLHPMLTACIEVPILGDRISRAATPHMQITLNREPHSVGSTQVSTHSHKNLIVCLPMWQKQDFCAPSYFLVCKYPFTRLTHVLRLSDCCSPSFMRASGNPRPQVHSIYIYIDIP